MLNTDLNGLWTSLKNNQSFHLFILLAVCTILYMTFSKNMYSSMEKNSFTNILYGGTGDYSGTGSYGGYGSNNTYCKGNIPKMDEAIILNSINLPNRNPAMLTSSMVIPAPNPPTDEVRRRTRMDILNMFYDSFDDDMTTINARPQNLYVIP